MLNPCNEIDAVVSSHDLHKNVAVGDYSVHLYVGQSADRLGSKGSLNFIILGPEGSAFTLPLASLRHARVRVSNQDALLEPNSSPVVDVWVEGGKLCAQHWDGYLSRFDITAGQLISQEFTK